MVVSVVVPVYNSEKLLDECILSVLNQDFDGFELILINDGSTDNSGKICDSYAADDHRVKVYHKTNGGVSSARNVGIENATGDWITFIDSDDYISKKYFNKISDYHGGNLLMQGLNYLENDKFIKGISYDEEVLKVQSFIMKYRLYPYFSSSCSKFYKNSLIKRHKIKFNENISFGEDTLFNLKYLMFCDNVRTTDSSTYNYRVTDTGLSNIPYDYEQDLAFYKETKKELEKYKNERFYNESILVSLSRLLTSMYGDTQIRYSERNHILREVFKRNYKVIFQIYTDPKIKAIIYFVHFTGLFFLLDWVLSNLNRE